MSNHDKPTAATTAGVGRLRDSAPGLAAGTLVGSFLIESLHASSGFAEVYRARHLPDNARAAVKVLHSELVLRPGLVRRFRQEAALLTRLRHPGVVEIWQSGETDDGRPYIAMEWIEGRTLARELAERGHFSPSDARSVIGEIATALDAAHQLGVIHRDLKADNVMTVPREPWFAIKLIDFGIAKVLEPPPGVATPSTTNTILGTPHNMAPEQILGKTVDKRVDIYALGVLLYQLVTGRLPFTGANAIEIQELHLSAPPPKASLVAPVPAGFDAIIARCLAKQPEQRYRDIAEFRAALDRASDIRSSTTAAVASRPQQRTVGLYVEARIGTRLGELSEAATEVLDRAASARPMSAAGKDSDEWSGGGGDDDDDELDDQLLDDVDRIMVLARTAVIEARMTIAVETSTTLLAVTGEPADDTASRTRAAVVRCGLELDARLRRREFGHDSVRTFITVHVAATDDLLRPGPWTADHPGGVMVSDAVLAGLPALGDSGDIESVPVAGHPDRRVLSLAQSVTLE